jgi:hypothetical protein
LLVCGGRDYDDRAHVFRVLDTLRPTLVIHGAASGADRAAWDWAELRGVPHMPFPVTDEEWRTIGKKAGPLRNQRMLDEGRPDAVLAFPGGRGTRDMKRRARAAEIPVVPVIPRATPDSAVTSEERP